MVAQTKVVPSTVMVHQERVPSFSISSRSPCPGRSTSPPRCSSSKINCLESTLNHFPEWVRTVLLHSRKPSTTWSYQYKWKRFLIFLCAEDIFPTMVTLSQIFAYLLSLAEGRLRHSSIRVHLSAISAHMDRGFFSFLSPGHFCEALRLRH